MKYSLQKRISAFVLAFALVMTTAFNSIGATTSASAAVKVKAVYKSTNAKAATVVEGTVKTFKIGVWTSKAVKKATVKKKLKVTSSNTDVVEVTTKTIKATQKTKKNAKKAGKASVFQYTAVKAGTATITAKYGKKKASFKVTVTAKSVEPTPSSSDASKEPTPAAVKLEKINVTADTTTITEKGGQAKLSVTSATQGAEIFKVTYKSSNVQFATVESDGTVTGVNPGKAIISVVATDAFGNEVPGSIEINVTEQLKSTVTLSKDDANIDMLVGDTHTLKPTAVRENGSAPELVYESSDNTVVTVSADGTITAVGEGTAKVTVKDKGTNGAAEAVIVVTAQGLGIVSANAVKANKIEVILSKAVSTADQANVTVTLSAGNETYKNANLSWDTTGKVVSFTAKTGNIDPNTYVVSVSSTKIQLDKNKDNLSKKVVVEAQKAASFTIKDGQIVPFSTAAKIYYEVKDQYGDVMDVTADQIDWYELTAENTALKFESNAIVKNNKMVNYVTINLTKQIKTGDKFVLDAKSVNEKINITGKIGDNKSTTKFTVSPVGIKSVSIDGVASKDATGKNVPNKDFSIEEQTTPKNALFSLMWSGIDSNGATVDNSLYNEGQTVYTGKINIVSSENNVNVTFNDDTKLFDVNVLGAVNKDFTLSARVGSEDFNTITIKVNPAAYVASMAYFNGASSANTTVEAGKTGAVNVKFVDQYGKDIKGDENNIDFFNPNLTTDNVTGVTTKNFIGGLTASANGTYMLSLNGDGVNLVDNSKAGTVTIKFNSNKAKLKSSDVMTEFTLTVTIGRKAYAASIVLKNGDKELATDGKNYVLNIIGGQEIDLTANIMDNYTKPIKVSNSVGMLASDATVLTNSAANTLTDGDHETFANGAFGMDTSGSTPVPYKKALSNANNFKVRVVADTVDSDKETTLTITLYNGTDSILSQALKVNIVKAPTAFTVSTDKTTYVAGQEVGLTIKSNSANYAGVFKDVEIREAAGANVDAYLTALAGTVGTGPSDTYATQGDKDTAVGAALGTAQGAATLLYKGDLTFAKNGSSNEAKFKQDLVKAKTSLAADATEIKKGTNTIYFISGTATDGTKLGITGTTINTSVFKVTQGDIAEIYVADGYNDAALTIKAMDKMKNVVTVPVGKALTIVKTSGDKDVSGLNGIYNGNSLNTTADNKFTVNIDGKYKITYSDVTSNEFTIDGATPVPAP